MSSRNLGSHNSENPYLFLEAFQGERPLVAGGRGAHELHAAEAAHPEGRQHVEVAQAHVLRFECRGKGLTQVSEGVFHAIMHLELCGDLLLLDGLDAGPLALVRVVLVPQLIQLSHQLLVK